MRRPLKFTQFKVIHLLVVIAAVAVLIQPAQVAYHWFITTPPPVSVPDGGTVVIAGIAIRSDGTRIKQTVIRLVKPPVDGGTPAGSLIMMPTLPIVIQPEIEEDTEGLVLWPSRNAEFR